MLPVEWVAGFIEGEGSFSGSMRTKTYFQPNFSLYQKELTILEQVQKFFLAHGIDSKIYVGTNGCYTLSVNAIWRCRLLYELIRPHMHAPYKMAQADTWHAKMVYSGRNVKDEGRSQAAMSKMSRDSDQGVSSNQRTCDTSVPHLLQSP